MVKAIFKSFRTKKSHDRVYPSLETKTVLQEKGTYNYFHIGGVPKGHSGRREQDGDMIPGPWHFIFGMTLIIHNGPHGKRKRVVTVSPGECIRIDGMLYQLVKSWNGVMVLSEPIET